jgi:hypothetical protein
MIVFRFRNNPEIILKYDPEINSGQQEESNMSCRPGLVVYDPETSSGSKNGFRHPEIVSGTILEMGDERQLTFALF